MRGAGCEGKQLRYFLRLLRKKQSMILSVEIFFKYTDPPKHDCKLFSRLNDKRKKRLIKEESTEHLVVIFRLILYLLLIF